MATLQNEHQFLSASQPNIQGLNTAQCWVTAHGHLDWNFSVIGFVRLTQPTGLKAQINLEDKLFSLQRLVVHPTLATKLFA
jgi:hypothetical protein